MVNLYILIGIVVVLFLLFFLIHLTYFPEEKALAKAKEEAAKRNQSTDWDKQQLINSLKESLKEKEEEINKKNEIVDQLRMELFDTKHNRIATDDYHDKYIALQESFDELEEEYYKEKQKNKIRSSLLNDSQEREQKLHSLYLSLHKKYTDLQIEHEKLEAENSRLTHDAIRCIREETWGGILRLKASEKYNLSTFRASQIKFPDLAPEKVFVLENRSTFHAVPWCYTLDKASHQLIEMDLFAAIEYKIAPCSKCVNPDDYSDYLKTYRDDS